jgi:hypothetical protein
LALSPKGPQDLFRWSDLLVAQTVLKSAFTRVSIVIVNWTAPSLLQYGSDDVTCSFGLFLPPPRFADFSLGQLGMQRKRLLPPEIASFKIEPSGLLAVGLRLPQ